MITLMKSKKNIWKQRTTKEKKEKRDYLNLDEKGQMWKYKKKGKKTMRDNLDIEEKEHLKIDDNKRKKRGWPKC